MTKSQTPDRQNFGSASHESGNLLLLTTTMSSALTLQSVVRLSTGKSHYIDFDCLIVRSRASSTCSRPRWHHFPSAEADCDLNTRTGVYQNVDQCYDACLAAFKTGYRLALMRMSGIFAEDTMDSRHVDSAVMYRNEEQVGKAIINSGLKREDVFFSMFSIYLWLG